MIGRGCRKAMSGLSSFLSVYVCHAYSVLSSVFSTQYRSCKYPKVQAKAREASSVGSCIHISNLYKSCFTSRGLHPCSLDVALLCHPIRTRKDREVSQQCASSTGRLSRLQQWRQCDSDRPLHSLKRRGLKTGIYILSAQSPSHHDHLMSMQLGWNGGPLFHNDNNSYIVWSQRSTHSLAAVLTWRQSVGD